MDDERWVLDGPIEEQIAYAKKRWGLRPDQSFQELKIPIEMTAEQRKELETFLPNLQRYIDDEDIIPLLKALDAKINEVGYDADHQLNATGQKLKKLYDELYEQN